MRYLSLVLLLSACQVGEPLDRPSSLAAEAPERRLNDVAFPGTHNSFATTDHYRFGFANQFAPISRQLEDGVRAFMLDTYWHKPLWKPARAALCHKWCTTGGYIDLEPELAAIADFLAANPEEIVLLIVEQHSLTPGQFTDVMADAGLLGLTYSHPSPATPWPTLGELVAAGERVVVFYENEPGDPAPPAYYHPLWDHAWETPYSFASVDELSCERNRGAAGAPLYLVNHFISRPAGTVSGSAEANATEVLLDRVQECEALQLPNIVAVDFYEPSLFEAVDYLNATP